MKSPRCNTRAQGFSLIELLIASVVIASVGSLLIGGLIAANRSADLRIEQTLSTQLLASQFALVHDRLSPDMPTRGTWTTPSGEFTWMLTWSPAPRSPLAETTLTVTKQDHANRVVTYRPLAEP